MRTAGVSQSPAWSVALEMQVEVLGEQVSNSAQGWIMSIINPTMVTSQHFQRGQVIAASFFVTKRAEDTDNTGGKKERH